MKDTLVTMIMQALVERKAELAEALRGKLREILEEERTRPYCTAPDASFLLARKVTFSMN